MILLFGGTTEGRKASSVLDEAGSSYLYSTKGVEQEIQLIHGLHITGTMDSQKMYELCQFHQIDLIIDAAHPFAEELHRTVALVSEQLTIPVIRYERIYPVCEYDHLIWCNDYEHAITELISRAICRPLFLTGVQTIAKFKSFWTHTPSLFRILNRNSSKALALREGFSEHLLLFYGVSNEAEIIIDQKIDSIITKESGLSGGFMEKIELAQKFNIPLFVIRRPKLSKNFITVNGEYGLRREVEKLLPSFFSLKTGITTGTCATAASIAGLRALLENEQPKEVDVILPNGESITVDITGYQKRKESIKAWVVKESGDDPDVTNGTTVIAEVRINQIDDCNRKTTIKIDGGEGIGRVTLEGLGLPIGSAAINKGPMGMIENNLKIMSKKYHKEFNIDVLISVPEGKELAIRTFNSRLGIIGGISIIGSTGIIKPFSNEAFIGAIRKGIEVAIASGAERIVINSGAKSERMIKSLYPELPNAAFVHYGNFIGETLTLCNQMNVKKVTMGIMIGKAVKLAAGHLDTHSHKVVMNKDFIVEQAKGAGCHSNSINEINKMVMAKELWYRLEEQEQIKLFDRLISSCYSHCKPLLPNGELMIKLLAE